MNAPKISVIIPLYNAERFIRQCLISVLASKFTDYEVIIVDDCSSDSSIAEVEKLRPHFDGRLKIFSTQTNSGGAGVPRNIGIENSSGKYVTFIDNDDLILPNALADFFAIAENFQADVVYAEKYFVTAAELDGKDMTVKFLGSIDDLVDAPTLEPADLRERILRDISEKFVIAPWGKFYRRDFLRANRIAFLQVNFAEDVTFCFKCLCLAKNYVRIPQMTNVHRELATSTGKKNLDSREGVRLWLNIFAKNISELDKFMSGLKFFGANPDVRGGVLNYYIGVHFGMIKNLFRSLPPHGVLEIFCDELQNPALDSSGKNLVAAHLYTERALTG